MSLNHIVTDTPDPLNVEFKDVKVDGTLNVQGQPSFNTTFKVAPATIYCEALPTGTPLGFSSISNQRATKIGNILVNFTQSCELDGLTPITGEQTLRFWVQLPYSASGGGHPQITCSGLNGSATVPLVFGGGAVFDSSKGFEAVVVDFKKPDGSNFNTSDLASYHSFNVSYGIAVP